MRRAVLTAHRAAFDSAQAKSGSSWESRTFLSAPSIQRLASRPTRWMFQSATSLARSMILSSIRPRLPSNGS